MLEKRRGEKPKPKNSSYAVPEYKARVGGLPCTYARDSVYYFAGLADYFGVAEAINGVVVHHADGLHECVADRRSRRI